MYSQLRIIDPFTSASGNDLPPENLVKKNNHMILFPMILWLILMLVAYAPCSAKGLIDYQGVTGFYGHSDWTNIGPAPADKYEWSNISYFVGKDFKSWLSVETLLGPGYIKTDNFGDTSTLEWRVLLDIHSKYLYFKLGAGVAYLFQSENMPDLSSANFFSIVSCGLGFRYRFGEEKKKGPVIMFGYSVEHLSDAFSDGDDGDTGLNLGAINLAVSWKF
ncbi:MAG: porin family protein [Desulfobacteraceae bacterium]|nr:porin family protein [Desulfobacteraceae bacterium]